MARGFLYCIDSVVLGEYATLRRNAPYGASHSQCEVSGIEGGNDWTAYALLQIPPDGWDWAVGRAQSGGGTAWTGYTPTEGWPLFTVHRSGADSVGVYYMPDATTESNNHFAVRTHDGAAYSNQIIGFVPQTGRDVALQPGAKLAVGLSYDSASGELRLSISVEGDEAGSTDVSGQSLDSSSAKTLQVGDENHSENGAQTPYWLVHALAENGASSTTEEMEAELASLSFALSSLGSGGRVSRSQDRKSTPVYRPARRV